MTRTVLIVTDSYKLDFKSAFKSIMWGCVAFVAMMIGFATGGMVGGVVVLGFMYALSGWKAKRAGQEFSLKNVLKGFFIFGLIMGFAQLITSYGWPWMHTIWLIGIPIILIARRWKTYMWAVETSQAAIWGEPLKNFKARGEPMPKVVLLKPSKPKKNKKEEKQ